MSQSVFDRVWNYAHDIVEGKIVACKKHKWAAQRFIDDIFALEKEESPYYFDADVVEDFNEWAKQFIHLEGILPGQPIILTDFQLFMAANIFGFYKKSNNARRFRKVYIQLARKNAKSQFLALIATYETFLTDEKHRVYIAGWSRDQSAEVYDAIHEQIQNAEILQGTYTDAYGKIKRYKTNSIIQPLSKEARKLGDGKNPSVGIVDEYHAHETSEIYDVLISGMVARKSPLMVVITTAGFDLSRPCYKEYQYVSKILDPNINTENDDYFVLICELDKDDDIKDESVWIKANPIVATYPEGIESIRSELKVALEQPEKMRSFLTKNMNIWVDKKDNGYMDMAKWAACGRVIDWEEFRGQEVIIGVDLSAKIDLTSVNFETQKESKYLNKNHSFMPEDTIAEKAKTDKAHYQLWEKQGWITSTPGAVVDYSFIKSYIQEKEATYDLIIKEICVDPWNATQFMIDMENEGYTVVEIGQTLKTLAEPTKDFRERVYKKELEHDDSPVLTWAMGNAVTRADPSDNIRLDKSKSIERIDPAAAAINSHARAMVLQFSKKSVYEERGITFL
ncbi:terminase large subunit [Bacillus sp. UNC322MFChir4.1]|uniref:terminase large subunit n=1 Tax=Bacillus sp. UNC322MFChir4.1 TaxID=1449045 RepID=UPI0005539BC5|nr:terminase TerL endonuclease subunit [Bacillus sp. UNC322MFChir4.1]